MQYSNQQNIPLPLAVWLANDTYGFHPADKQISATTLLKPVKALALLPEVDKTKEVDVLDVLASRIGTSIHDSVEKAWTRTYGQSMQALGISESMIKKVRINPDKPEQGKLDVHLEKRSQTTINGWTVSGQFDMVLNGHVYDIKTTKVYSWIKGSSFEDYRKQLSIYAMLNPEIITSENGTILFVFTDWSPLKAMATKGNNADYPQTAITSKEMPLNSPEVTRDWISSKLQHVESLIGKPQKDMPSCTPQELWQTPSTYAVYKNPKKLDRATRVFDLYEDAVRYSLQSCNGTGHIVHRPGEARACKWCPAASICEQGKQLL